MYNNSNSARALPGGWGLEHHSVTHTCFSYHLPLMCFSRLACGQRFVWIQHNALQCLFSPIDKLKVFGEVSIQYFLAAITPVCPPVLEVRNPSLPGSAFLICVCVCFQKDYIQSGWPLDVIPSCHDSSDQKEEKIPTAV